MKKSPNQRAMKNIAFLALISIVLIAFLVGLRDKEEPQSISTGPSVVEPSEEPPVQQAPPPQQEVPAPPPEPTPQPPAQPTPEEPTETPEVPVTIPEEPPVEEEIETITGVCEEGFIDVTLTNTFEESVDLIGLTWWISGRLDTNVECDKETIEPGESTLCPSVNYYRMGSFRIVTVYIFKKPYSIKVDCGKYAGV